MKRLILALCAAVGLGACGSMEVPDLNNPSVDELLERPTRANVAAATTGLLMGRRVGVSAQNGYVAQLGVLGRESYTFDGADPRSVTEMLVSPQLDPSSLAFGGNYWANPYANIHNAFVILHALEKVPGVSDAEKEATRGFAKTIMALDFLVVINTHDTNGAPIDVDRELGDELAPIEPKPVVMAHIATLLDQAKAHLEAGGDAFPFQLSSGFAGFDTPASFLEFNRAVKARVEVYRGNYAEALDALAESFIDPNAPLTKGVYDAFGSGPGDAPNGLTNPNLYAHPSIKTDAENRPDGQPDNRLTLKVKQVDSRTFQELTSNLAFTLYTSSDADIPIIRNEELILLRAEANIGRGTAEGIAAAADDINFIRTTSGGLAPRLDLDASNILDELLEQKRYSLLFEGGHRWIDLRRYGKLDTLPKDRPNHVIHERFPIPSQEMDARQ